VRAARPARLDDGRLERNGKLRQLVAERRLLSAQLADWFGVLGLTPDARATWAARPARPSLAETIAARVREIEEQEANGDGGQYALGAPGGDRLRG
jgi:hypothetical protein